MGLGAKHLCLRLKMIVLNFRDYNQNWILFVSQKTKGKKKKNFPPFICWVVHNSRLYPWNQLISSAIFGKRANKLNLLLSQLISMKFFEEIISSAPHRDGSFSPSCLTHLSPLHPARVFLASQRWWGEDGARF